MTGPNLAGVVGTTTTYDYESLEEAFPEVDAGVEPYGTRILVQIRSPKSKTKGGIIVPNDSRETELWNTQVAKVICLGPVAFKNRDTLEEWPEGAWCQPGTYVRVPKYGGDRWYVPVPDSKVNAQALFTLFKDTDIIGKITCDPLEVVAFL